MYGFICSEIHLCSCICQFFFCNCWKIFIVGIYYNLFFHLLAHEHLACFQFCVTMNKAAKNICIMVKEHHLLEFIKVSFGDWYIIYSCKYSICARKCVFSMCQVILHKFSSSNLLFRHLSAYFFLCCIH